MKVKTPLGEYPFQFSRLERRAGGLAVIGTVAGMESSIVLGREDLDAAVRVLGPPLALAALAALAFRRSR